VSEISDRRDQMMLTMAVHAACVKAKSREAFRKKKRLVEYRGVRYQRFNGRRDDAIERKASDARRAHRAKSIQKMAEWLEAQGRANAEEGRPRAEKVREDAFAVLLGATLPPAAPLVEVEEGAEGTPERGLQPITFFFPFARWCESKGSKIAPL
jgi:hypothetical protein